MAPILEIFGPFLAALFVHQSPDQEQQQTSTTISTISLRRSFLDSLVFRDSQSSNHGYQCSPFASRHNHLSFAGDAAAQLLFTTSGHMTGLRSSCINPTATGAMTPHRSKTTSNTVLLAASRAEKAEPSTLAFVSSVLGLSNDNDDSTILQGNSSRVAALAIVSSLMDGVQNNAHAVFYMILLALQFGFQPMLTKKFTPKTVNRSTVVFAQEIVKFVAAALILFFSGGWSAAVSGWDAKSSLMVAGIPAFLYSIQNLATLVAYQNLDPLTFNVLNQTKTLSAALCCYLLMGKVQSRMQIVSLGILFTASCVIEKIINLDELFGWIASMTGFRDRDRNESVTKSSEDTPMKGGRGASASATKVSYTGTHAQGVAAVLTASFISGLAGALTQKSLQGSKGRNSYLFTMELCVVSMFFLASSMWANPNDREQLTSSAGGFFKGWTPQTIIPILTNAAGGIVVGLVTKYAGAVKKGFALIFGLLLSGLLQARMAAVNKGTDNDDGPRITKEQIVGGLLAAISLWMHSSFPAP